MPYNPYGYVPGGSSPLVSQAIQERGYGLGAPTFDINSLIANDPMMRGQLQQIGWGDQGPTGTGMLGQALAPLDEATQRYLINYGAVPQGVNASDTVRGLANDATVGGLSQLAQLRHSQMLANSAARGSVGARGLGRSGAYGYHAAENQRGYDVGRASLQDQLMQALSGVQQQRVAATNTAFGQAQTSANDAYQRVIAQINNGTIAQPTNLTNATLPIPQPTGAGSVAPRTNPATFHASPRPQIGAGQPGNKFQVLPGRGRAPFGDYRTTSLPAAYGGRAR
jgi:hypothetical protein